MVAPLLIIREVFARWKNKECAKIRKMGLEQEFK